jgi:hypothetical protein
MTEAEWMNGWDYGRMFRVIHRRFTTRQARLFMVACCRLNAAAFFDPRIQSALEAAEKCADDPVIEALATRISAEFWKSPHSQHSQTPAEKAAARSIYGAQELLDAVWAGSRYTDTRQAIAHAVYLSLRSHPQEVFTGGAGNAAWYCARAIDSADSLLRGLKPLDDDDEEPESETDIRKAIASLLRDIVGNPFRPVALNCSWLGWNDGTVPRIAQGIYDERAFERMPILADALEDAGCDNPDILDHCRNAGPHVRGCWVVDAVLEKE